MTSATASDDLPTLPLAWSSLGSVEPHSSARYGHASCHLVLHQGNEVVIARASADRVQLLSSGDAELEAALTFPPADQDDDAQDALVRCVAISQPDPLSSRVLLAASSGSRVHVWASSSPASGARKWTEQSSLRATGGSEIVSLSLHRGKLLIGTADGLALWELPSSDVADSRIWVQRWRCRAPDGRSIASARWAPSGTHFGACLKDDRRVLIWTLPADGKPTLSDRLVLPRRVKSIHWRQPPIAQQDQSGSYASRGSSVASSSSSPVLLVQCADEVFRIYTPVIDQPAKFRLWASSDECSFGISQDPLKNAGLMATTPPRRHGATVYLDAGDLSAACTVSLQQMRGELQRLELGVGTSAEDGGAASSSSTGDETERRKDLLRTRIRRLEHFMLDTPDMFLRIDSDGEIVIRGTANVDRTPPSLVQNYTALKMRHSSRELTQVLSRPGRLHFTPLIPRALAGTSAAPSAALHLVADDGSCATVLVSPQLLFDGDEQGLVLTQASTGSADDERSTDNPMRRRGGHCQRILALFCADDREVLSVARAQGGGCEAIRWRTGRRGRLEQISLPMTFAERADLMASAGGNTFIAARDGILLRSSEHAQSVPWPAPDARCIAMVSVSNGVVGVDSSGNAVMVDSTGGIEHLPSLSGIASADIRSASLTIEGEGESVSVLCAALVGHDTLCAWRMSLNGKEMWADMSSTNLDGVQDAKLDIARSGLVSIAGSDVDGSGHTLVIWNAKAGLFSEGVEHRQSASAAISSTTWNADGTVLAVARGASVELLVPARWDEARQSQAWLPIVKIKCDAWCPRVDALCFGPDDFLLVASSNIMRSFAPWSATEGRSRAHIRELRAAVCGPLPQYHPTFLHHCLLFGRVDAVLQILHDAHAALLQAGEENSPHAAVSEVDLLSPLQEQVHSSSAGRSGFFDEVAAPTTARHNLLSDSMVEDLDQRLSLNRLVGLTSDDQHVLKRIARVVLEVDGQRGALDVSGVRFLVALRQMAQEKLIHGAKESTLDHRDMLWAFHSETQELIVSAVSSLYHNKVTWPAARATGLFMWLDSQDSLRAQAENVARSQFMAKEDRDPVDCSLLYFALGKQALVHGLWRQAAWHPEQRKMLTFLSNDFSEARWKAAALKNAFVLLSQRRFDFAATFFMLADSLKDAVNVCIRYLDDMQLAVAICRIREGGTDGPVLAALLREHVLPLALQRGDRFLASWALWLLHKRRLAVRALVVPLPGLLLEDGGSALVTDKVQHCAFGRSADPALALLFLHLKGHLQSTANRAPVVSPELERAFAIHANEVFWRMGCPSLGLLLLREWKFDRPELSHSKVQHVGTVSATTTTSTAMRSKWQVPIDLTDRETSAHHTERQSQTETSKVAAEVPAPQKAKANLMKVTATDQQQQASQAFDFSSFGF